MRHKHEMDKVSVIIITRNEAANIGACVDSARMLTDDIVVIDSGSTDDTVAIAHKAGARILNIVWNGFGDARNQGAAQTRYDWVLALDADERITMDLVGSIKALDAHANGAIYGFKRQNYFMGRKILFGEWGRDKVFRLYHKARVSWDLSPVHEVLTGEGTAQKIISGFVKHFPVRNASQNTEKTNRYASLNAEKYFQNGKDASFVKRFFSPVFNFLKMYVLLLGFLDGKAGFEIAWATTRYVWLKYHLLHQMRKGKIKPKPMQ